MGQQVAQFDRRYLLLPDALERVLARLPFPNRDVPVSIGAEFFTDHIGRFWKHRPGLSGSQPT